MAANLHCEISSSRRAEGNSPPPNTGGHVRALDTFSLLMADLLGRLLSDVSLGITGGKIRKDGKKKGRTEGREGRKKKRTQH